MTKTKNKFLFVSLIGLLLSVASFSYAQIIERIEAQDSHKFLEKNLNSSSFGEFKKKYGEDMKDVNVVDCGTSKCNIAYRVCMKKEDDANFWRSLGNTFLNTSYKTSRGTAVGAVAGSAFAGVGSVAGAGIGAISGFTEAAITDGWITTVTTRYVCVDKNEQASYEKNGYTVAAEGGLTTHTGRNQWGQVKGQTVKEIKDEDCYLAQTAKVEAKYYCIKVVGDVAIVNAAINADGKGSCPVVPVSLYNSRKCTFCSMLGVVFKVSDNITVLSYSKLAPSFAIIMALGLAIWIAMKTLIFVSSLSKQDAAKYITEMLKQSYKFVIAYFALIYFNNVFDYIIAPLLNAGLVFSQAFLGISSTEYRFGEDVYTALMSGNLENIQAIQGELQSDYVRNLDNQYYNIVLYSQLEQLSYMVNLNYSLLQSIGSSLWCLGKKYVFLILGDGTDGSWGLGWGCLIYGLCFSVFGFLLSIAFVFYLFDAVVQLGIVGALLPFLIASWPFKITSKYTSTGFKMFLNSVFTFMMMGMVVKINIGLISTAVDMNTNGDIGETAGLEALVTALDKIDTKTLKKIVNIWSVGFLLFMFANIMGFLMMAKVSEFTNRFASGGMKAAAPSIATMGASAIKGTASKLTAPTREAIGDWAEEKVEGSVRKTMEFTGNRLKLKWTRKLIFGKRYQRKENERNEKMQQQTESAKQEMFGDGKAKPVVIRGNTTLESEKTKQNMEQNASQNTNPNKVTIKGDDTPTDKNKTDQSTQNKPQQAPVSTDEKGQQGHKSGNLGDIE